MNSTNVRNAGILLHITSLPSAYGIGDLGPEAYAMADWLAKARINLWQLLPLGPTGYGNSPYAARSTFAGNELMIDLEQLLLQGFLKASDVADHPTFPAQRVDFDAVQRWKLPLLKQAATAFLDQGKDKQACFAEFCSQHSFWLDEYAHFMVLMEQYGDGRWFSHWPKEYATREGEALRQFASDHEMQIMQWKVLQFFFSQQWKAFKHYVNSKNIQLIGDVPIFVAADSADAWSNLHLFKTDEKGHFRAVSGVPPDFFSATGQLWGNPVYDWKVLEQEGYAWWLKRLERLFSLTDILRIDHFRGFDAYYEIPSGEKTAEHGKWVNVDGDAFFKAVRKRFGSVPIIAEDLGIMTESVRRLRDGNDLPGMKIFQFGFTRDKDGMPNYHDDFLPHNWGENFVVYTGTHDNNTTAGWFASLGREDKDIVLSYLGCEEKDLLSSMLRLLMLSHARTAVIPMQDVLGKGEEARMNYPSTCNDRNWSWRMEKHACTDSLAQSLSHLVEISARTGKHADELL